MPKTLIKLLVALVASVFVAVIFMTVQLQRYLDSPLAIPASGIEYSLTKGGSLGVVAYGLSRQNVLEYPRALTLYSRFTGRGVAVKAGDYFFQAGITPRQLLDKLEKGDVRYYTVTLIEGWRETQLLEALHAQKKLKSLLSLEATAGLSAEQLGIEASYLSLEGLFFPDTYRYDSGTTDVELLRQAYHRMQQLLADEWRGRDENLPYENAYQALIMASLIEKETGVARERAEIAGVFVRRLQQNMRLQTDPATIYGLGAAFDGNLRRRHLKDVSNRYNTYRHHGLPPTPIALAGREAIHAALHPAAGDTLYFVAKGDGSHYFSRTFEQHQRAVRKYQIYQRRSDYSSSPASKHSG